jgi:hypothetical protein
MVTIVDNEPLGMDFGQVILPSRLMVERLADIVNKYRFARSSTLAQQNGPSILGN